MINNRLKKRGKTDGQLPAPISPVSGSQSIYFPETNVQDSGPGDTGPETGSGSGHPPYASPVPSGCTIPARSWFFTFMCMNIPVAGWIYLLSKAFGKKQSWLRDFARAYLLYKLVFLVITLSLLGILFYIGLNIADKVLAYMEML